MAKCEHMEFVSSIFAELQLCKLYQDISVVALTHSVFYVLNLTASLHSVLLKSILVAKLCDATIKFEKKIHKNATTFKLSKYRKKHTVDNRRQDSH